MSEKAEPVGALSASPAMDALTREAQEKPYYSECREVGRAKLETQARSLGVELDMDTFRASGIDDRRFNPSKYMWWSAGVSNTNGRTDLFKEGTPPTLQVLTQRPGSGRCY